MNRKPGMRVSITALCALGLLLGRVSGAGAAAPEVHALTNTWDRPPQAFPRAQSTDAPLLGNGSMAACFGGPAHQLRFYINRNDFWRLCRSEACAQKVASILDVNMDGLAGASYRLDQAIRDGAVTGAWVRDNLAVSMTCWLAATEDLLVVTLSAERGTLPVAVALRTLAGSGAEVNSGSAGPVAWVSRTFAQDVDTPTEAATALRVLGADGPTFTLRPGRPVTLLVATASAFQSARPAEAAQKHLARLTESMLAAVRGQHDAWWADYWKRSRVRVDDPLLMKGYYQGLYTLAAACRNPRFPPGLFGPWITDDNPSWSNDYHLNYNFQAAFYGLCSANRIEQADTEIGPVLAFMPQGRWYAEQVTKTRGVLYPVGIGPLGAEPSRGVAYGREQGSAEQGGLFHHQRSDALYCTVNMAQRWRCTYDPEYARKVYPFVRAVVEFWEDYLQRVDGRYQVWGDAIHELSGPNKNPVLTLGLLRNALDLALDMSQALGMDASRREKWRHIQANLADFPVQERDGRTVFRLTSEGLAWCDANTLGIQHIYPGNAITLNSAPELLAVARNTLAAMNRWHDGNGANSFFPAAVRAGLDPEVILESLRAYVRDTSPNGFRAGNVHGVENCSTVHNTLNEMLCMSVGHVLRLFPVWPRNRDAAFAGLRAWDAFLVSAELKGGVVGDVKLVSERGRDATLVNPWPGRAVQLVRDGRKKEVLSGDRLTFRSRAGETIKLAPAEPASKRRKGAGPGAR